MRPTRRSSEGRDAARTGGDERTGAARRAQSRRPVGLALLAKSPHPQHKYTHAERQVIDPIFPIIEHALHVRRWVRPVLLLSFLALVFRFVRFFDTPIVASIVGPSVPNALYPEWSDIINSVPGVTTLAIAVAGFAWSFHEKRYFAKKVAGPLAEVRDRLGQDHRALNRICTAMTQEEGRRGRTEEHAERKARKRVARIMGMTTSQLNAELDRKVPYAT